MSNSLVVGLDGVVPIYNPAGLWQWWSLDSVYVGQQGSEKYVPKVSDYVIDPGTYTTYIDRKSVV